MFSEVAALILTGVLPTLTCAAAFRLLGLS